MKTPLVFQTLDALLLLGYGVILITNLIRRIFSRRLKV